LDGKRIDDDCLHINGHPALATAPARDGASVSICEISHDDGRADVYAVYNLNSGGVVMANLWAAPFYSQDFETALAIYNARKLSNS
jgi:hypothetical protein